MIRGGAGKLKGRRNRRPSVIHIGLRTVRGGAPYANRPMRRALHRFSRQMISVLQTPDVKWFTLKW